MDSLTYNGTTKTIDPRTGMALVNGQPAQAPAGSLTANLGVNSYSPPNLAQIVASRSGTSYQPQVAGGGPASPAGAQATYSQSVPTGYGSTSASSGTTNPYASKLDELIGILQGHLTASDPQIAEQANALYSAQRAVADREIRGQLNSALGENGTLPTGGLASRMYQELAAPIDERINAQRAASEIELRQNRNNGYQQLTGTLAGVQNNWAQLEASKANQAAQLTLDRERAAMQQRQFDAELAQKGQLASQQLAADQARLAQANQMEQARLDYQKMSDQQKLAFQREALTAEQNQRLAAEQNLRASAGGGRGGASGGGSGSAPWNFDMGLGAGMRDNYNNMNAAENLRSGRAADGSYDGNSRSNLFQNSPSQRGAYDAQVRQNDPTWSGGGVSGTPQVVPYNNPAGGTGMASGGSGFGLTAGSQSFYRPPASGSNFTAATGFGSASQMSSGPSGLTSFYTWGA